MANKKKPAAKPSADAVAAKAATVQRWARAQQACHAVIDGFDQLETDGGLAEHALALKYVQMCRVYFKKLRNGNVLSSPDFDVAVALCTAARRALLQLDGALQFAGWPQATALQQMGTLAYGVLDDNYRLGGPNSKRPQPF